jgi:uroporphyrinogen-III decarboxylase
MIPAKYKFIREVGKGKSGISSLVVCDGVEYIYKEMHSETVSYYHFSGPKINLEIDAYKILEKHVSGNIYSRLSGKPVFPVKSEDDFPSFVGN